MELTESQSVIVNNLEALSLRCVNTYKAEDIIEHFEEELLEGALAWKRVSRRREDLPSFLEEIIDISIECNTVMTLLTEEGLVTDQEIQDMLSKKLEKFKAMLDRDEREWVDNGYGSMELGPKKNRYKGLPSVGSI